MVEKMNKIYIFDVDGTLTPSRLPMTQEFQNFFSIWSEMNTFYLITGSDLSKLQEQMCFFDIEAERIFTCCGNEMWHPEPHLEQVYRKEFKPPNNLISYLNEQLRITDYPVKAGNHIEDRGTLLNFSIVGRDCSLQQRKDYNEYDTLTSERKTIAKYIKNNWNDLDAVLGGEISIDIYPKGNDKSQIFDFIRKRNLEAEIIFIGDGIENKGNDYSLAKLMDTKLNCKWYNTNGWKHTKQILESLSD